MDIDIPNQPENIENITGPRVDDRAFLALVRKCFKAGILDIDGQVFHPATGSPQGGTPSLASGVFV